MSQIQRTGTPWDIPGHPETSWKSLKCDMISLDLVSRKVPGQPKPGQGLRVSSGLHMQVLSSNSAYYSQKPQDDL